MFHFKQFSVDQSGCAMKINTDGVLLGAITQADDPKTILDIGTGTGVIALMLAQKFANAKIDAVEIDEPAAKTAGRNFQNSIFYNRLNIHFSSIRDFLDEHTENKYDLIISNPPFYINSLESPKEKKSLAKHSEVNFFDELAKDVSFYLADKGFCWLVLPLDTAALVTTLMAKNDMHLQREISIHSYPHSAAHRVVLCFGFKDVAPEMSKLTIYKAVGIYSEEYQRLLQPYFLAF
ncbi:tRNA1(Val) (adenine(37)-N6)-methyltransferase [Mucilaginibacter gotjawali]|uniref:tRNA1Val (Adenine37-N6)-methyltransferase n=2 Tax=Mucilaginibacter gotjawali TaxID=1550579 RepID=A0A839SLP2_9SPHI|nr:methyltransferase [Mucilaginibacter gotjawali]MBB3058462.1 tRNA1Val (adenine37-N6)-methyltransferase [Mucilaginibacter gotjawali]BAU53709.1 tRNA1(Val) (adenine(37)-N6)-methyltransferase [Mucilaginibacter gotjawali]